MPLNDPEITRPVSRPHPPSAAGPAAATGLGPRPDTAGSAGSAAYRPGGSDLSAYYAGGSGANTVAFPVGEENSGSLTGHILAQGWTDTPAERSGNTLRVLIVLAVALGLLVAFSVLVVLLTNDALSGLTG
ncbi:hypothetical protein [Verrucosispora sp. TAA-831]|uniref:hypothetical protein n=1 Tax=Verrucosispora sp. TAA-831 TaxID=3422227 RepID=UPI003D6F881A